MGWTTTAFSGGGTIGNQDEWFVECYRGLNSNDVGISTPSPVAPFVALPT